MTAVAQSEAQFQRAVVDLAEMCAWNVAHFHDSRRQVKPGVFVGDRAAAGVPDLLMARGLRLVFAELKSAKGRVRTEQQAWLDVLSECKSVEVYLWRPDDWDEIERVLL